MASVVSRLHRATEKSGRPLEAVRLVAVTKVQPVEMIQQALDAGLTELAQNRVQEAEVKGPLLKGRYTHHLIGQLQRNKARKAVHLFDLIQTVDSLRLAEALNRVAGEEKKVQPCLVEVKISDEATKSGISWDDATAFIEGFNAYTNLKLEGLMAVGPLKVAEPERRVLYRKFADFFNLHRSRFGDKPVLSLGMSDDFEMAIEEGSTMVRLGRVLFGERRVG